ncbi:CHAD domain-containing protein [Allostreptomyces psammosilenae]|uniref:CHAD domain-containing protein n=1 Tax=Allostreptomyces psammosilenae TaxID=1892865 RepID=A0A852ZVJ3_9ACTN|nr:CHAD domain-containing protein [Allostreptomyces psammosilenae]NYI04804.1 CHAD domain-containing protein [Allostreptomyces psammosilenae]
MGGDREPAHGHDAARHHTPRDRATAYDPPAPGSAGAVVLTRLRGLVHELYALELAVRRDEPDAVHRMRVATRRLRSALKTYRKVLDRAATDPVEAELKWLGAVLGRARDAEVLRDRLTTQLRALPPELVLGPVQARIVGRSTRDYHDAHRRIVQALDGPRHAALRGALDAVLERPPLRPAAWRKARPVLERVERRERRRVAARLEAAYALEPGPERDAALHEARKAAKRARYAGETARGVLGKSGRRFTRRMKRLHQALGTHQDAVASREALRLLGVQAHGAGENAFTYGLLHHAQTAEAEAVAAEVRGRAKHLLS